jgi:hypothetical protein
MDLNEGDLFLIQVFNTRSTDSILIRSFIHHSHDCSHESDLYVQIHLKERSDMSRLKSAQHPQQGLYALCGQKDITILVR